MPELFTPNSPYGGLRTGCMIVIFCTLYSLSTSEDSARALLMQLHLWSDKSRPLVGDRELVDLLGRSYFDPI